MTAERIDTLLQFAREGDVISFRPGNIGVRGNEFWKLFVDGEESMVGISSITIVKDMEIEWRTEKIEDYFG